MMRVLLHICIALTLFVIETSFFASLGGIIRYTPFVFAVSVYLLQHHGITSASSWMVIHGFLLDILHYSQTPFIMLAYVIAAIVAILSAQYVFSNRSIYGVITCALISYTSYIFSVLLLRFIGSFIIRQPFGWAIVIQDIQAQFITLFIFLIILFLFAKRIRFVLIKLFLIPQSRQTY